MKQWLRAHEGRSMNRAVIKGKNCRLMNQAITTGTWEPFNETSYEYGHIWAVQWIKQRLRAHERRSTNQADIKGKMVPFKESSNEYGHMRAVQWMKQGLRLSESRSKKQECTTGTWEPFNESSNDYGTWERFNQSSNDYGHMRAVQWIKQWQRAHESRSINQAVIKGTKCR
jgi:hypothetical protein